MWTFVEGRAGACARACKEEVAALGLEGEPKFSIVLPERAIKRSSRCPQRREVGGRGEGWRESVREYIYSHFVLHI